MSNLATNGGVPPRPLPPRKPERPDPADETATRLWIGLAWMVGIATVIAASVFALMLLGPLMIPPLCVLLYVVLHYFLWGRWLGPRLRALAEEHDRSES